MSLYSYHYRLHPNETQQILLSKHFGAMRYVYNYFLSIRIEKYQELKKSSTYFQDCKTLTELKKILPWMREIGSQSLQFAIKCLDAGYNNFFQGRERFPKFKVRYANQSFRVLQSIRIINDKLKIPKFPEGIKFIKHRELEGMIKFVTISKNKANQYYVSITVERNISKLPRTNNEVGVDLGIKTLATCSDGKTYKNIKTYCTLKKKIKILQRRLSKKQKGSKNRERSKKKLARIYLKIKNKRQDHLHKTTSKIIHENQVICLETLAVQNMMKNHKLAEAIQDASFFEFNRQLEYKAKWYGRQIVRISRWFPSSKTCCGCGHINQNLKLKERVWTCQSCGITHDRDMNAAKMILKQGKIQDKLPLEQWEVKRMDSDMKLTDTSVG